MIGTYTGDSVTWQQFAGLDEYNNPASPTEVALDCRYVPSIRRVIDFNGEEVLSSGHIKMASKPDPRDTFVVNGTKHVIASYRERRSFSRASHYEVFLR
jgi:hypothetical protein